LLGACDEMCRQDRYTMK